MIVEHLVLNKRSNFIFLFPENVHMKRNNILIHTSEPVGVYIDKISHTSVDHSLQKPVQKLGLCIKQYIELITRKNIDVNNFIEYFYL